MDRSRINPWSRVALAAVILGLVVPTTLAQEHENPPRLGRMITIKGVVDSSLANRVTNAAMAAARDGVEVLIFDLQPANSDFGPCRDLADRISKLGGSIKRTVAYVGQPVTGHGVLVALACQEIVMADRAKIGDVYSGRGDEVDRTERTAYEEIASRTGHDKWVVLGMVEKSLRLVEVTTPNGKRILPEDQLAEFVKGARVLKQEVVKEAGERLLLDTAMARKLGLVRRTADSRADVAIAYGLPEQVAANDELFREAAKPYLLKIEGALTGRLEQYVSRRLQQAKARGSNLLFVQIDSKTGEEQVASKIADMLDRWPEKKIAWVGPGAHVTGPAVLLLFGCDELVCAPSSTIGGFRVDGAGAKEYEAFARAAAELAKGSKYPEAVVRGMIDPAVELVEVQPADKPGVRAFRTLDEIDEPDQKAAWRRIRVVKMKGSPPPQLTGDEARSIDLATATAGSTEEMQAAYDVAGRLPVLQPSWVDSLIDGLMSTGGTFFLIVIGMTCLYIEFQMPGFGVAGVLSAVCFALFFWSRYLSDTANSLEIMMFLLGLAFLAVELFILPGFTITGLAGVGLIVGSLLLASQSFTLPRSDAEARELLRNVLTMAASMTVFLITSISIARFLPSMPLFSRMVLAPPSPEAAIEEEADDSGVEPPPHAEILGQQGVAVSPLRPAGRMLLDGAYYDVVAQGSFIEPGVPVEVIHVSSTRIVVRDSSIRT